MYTYSLEFRALTGDLARSQDDDGIRDILEAAHCQLTKAEYPFYEVQHERTFAGFEPYIQGHFEAGEATSPVRIYPGSLADFRRVLTAEANDPRTHAARIARQLVNQHAASPVTEPLRARPMDLYQALLSATEQLYRTELNPALPVIKGQLQHIQAQQAGLMERWVALEREELRLGKLLNPGSQGYYDNARYQGTPGLLNLCVQRVIWEFLDTYSPTDDHGEVMGDGDRPTYDLGWSLLNFLDGELDFADARQGQLLQQVLTDFGPVSLAEARDLSEDDRTAILLKFEEEAVTEHDAALDYARRELGIVD